MLILAKLVALWKEVYIGQTFGIGIVLDAYFIAHSVSLILPSVIVAIIPSLLIPIFISDNDSRFLRSLWGQLILLSLLIGLLNGIALLFFYENISSIYKTDGNLLTTELLERFIRYLSIIPVFTFLIAIFSSFLIANKKNINSVIEIIPNFTIIAVVYYFSGAFFEDSLIAGTIFGVFFQAFCLIALCVFRYDVKFDLTISGASAGTVIRLAQGAAILFIGQLFMSLSGPLDNNFAVEFGEGSVAAYNYSMRLIGIGISLISVMVIRVILPRFSELENGNRYEELGREVIVYSMLVFMASAIVCLIAVPFLDSFISFVFKGGELSSDALGIVNNLTAVGLLQVPFFAASLIIVQFFIVKKMYNLIAIFAITNLIVKYVSNDFLIEVFGLDGLMYSWAVMYLWSFFCLYTYYRLKFKESMDNV